MPFEGTAGPCGLREVLHRLHLALTAAPEAPTAQEQGAALSHTDHLDGVTRAWPRSCFQTRLSGNLDVRSEGEKWR